MPTFNVSFLNPSLKSKAGGTGIGIISDEITILENELSRDGYLSQGDYDLLLDKTREAQATPGLSAAKRKDFDVKISNYEKNKTIAKNEKAEDIGVMNRTLTSEKADDVMIAGNNPTEFLNGQVASLKAKLDDLGEAIERRNAAGSDVTEHQNEWNETLQAYQNSVAGLDSAAKFNPESGAPIAGYAAYVTTNNNGEIVDVDYGRFGSKTGFIETNGMIDGFQVFGKANAKRDGKNFFVLGNQTFSGADMIIPDPNNPGSFKPNKLVADVEQRGPIAVGKSGFLNMPGTTIQTQSYLPRNSWGKGVNGTLYKRRDDGGYSKYLNTDINTLTDVSENEILNLPQNFETNLMRHVDETIDGAEPVIPDEGFSMAPIGGPNIPEAAFPRQPEHPLVKPQEPTSVPEATTVGTKRSARPTEVAGAGFQDTAKRTIQSGVDFVKNIFS